MIKPLHRWGPRGLFASWIAYWIILAAVKLGPAITAIWRATHTGPDQSSVSFNFNGAVFDLLVKTGGRTTWSGSAHLLVIAAWLAVPPLLLWLIWVTQRTRAESPESLGAA